MRETVVALVSVPDVPVTVTVTVPVVAVLLAVIVRVLVFVVLAGLNEGVTPLGRPEADKLTLPLKPLSGAFEDSATASMPGNAATFVTTES